MKTPQPHEEGLVSDTQAPQVLYDGGMLCHQNGCCPVVESLPNGRIRFHDPAKPENGQFTCTREEYNLLLQHAQPARA